MPSQEIKALSRYNAMKALIQNAENGCNVEWLNAWMFDKYGIRKRTVSQYFAVMQTLGFISFSQDFKTVLWNGERGDAQPS